MGSRGRAPLLLLHAVGLTALLLCLASAGVDGQPPPEPHDFVQSTMATKFAASASGSFYEVKRYPDGVPEITDHRPAKHMLNVDQTTGAVQVVMEGGTGEITIEYYVFGKRATVAVVAVCGKSGSGLKLTDAAVSGGYTLDVGHSNVIMPPEEVAEVAWKDTFAVSVMHKSFNDAKKVLVAGLFCRRGDRTLFGHKACYWSHKRYQRYANNWYQRKHYGTSRDLYVCCRASRHDPCSTSGSSFSTKAGDKDMRLNHGTKKHGGRLEVYFSRWNKWGTVLTSGRWWNNRNAKVACRDMRLPWQRARGKTEGSIPRSELAAPLFWSSKTFLAQPNAAGFTKGKFTSSDAARRLSGSSYWAQETSPWRQTPGIGNASDFYYFKILAADVNGDRRDDVVVISGDAGGSWSDNAMVDEYQGYNQGFEGKKWPTALPSKIAGYTRKVRTFAGDFNGDGRQDLMTVRMSRNTRGHNAIYVDYSLKESRFETVHVQTELATTLPNILRAAKCNGANCLRIHTGDFNGDGRDDVLIFSTLKNANVQAKESMSLLLAHGKTFKTVNWASKVTAAIHEQPQRRFCFVSFAADFNGDGMTDVAVFSKKRGSDESRWDNSVAMELSRGNKFVSEWWEAGVVERAMSVTQGCWGRQFYQLTADVNGDGKADIVSVAYPRQHGMRKAGWATGFNVCLSTGTGFTCSFWLTETARLLHRQETIWRKNGIRVLAGDVNGDGTDDLVTFNIPHLESGDFVHKVYMELSDRSGKFTSVVSASPLPESMFRTGVKLSFFRTMGLRDKKCIRQCGNDGVIDSNRCVCQCNTPWDGPSCRTCVRKCENGGTLEPGACTCDCRNNWTGDNCESCSQSCLNGGVMNEEHCKCNCKKKQWGGSLCHKCVRKCLHGGVLDSDKCECDCERAKWWQGASCEEEKYISHVEDGMDVRLAIKITTRYVNEMRRKCMPQRLPPITQASFVEAKVHRDIDGRVNKFKLKLRFGTSPVEAYDLTQDRRSWKVTNDNDPCLIASYANEWHTLTKDELENEKLRSVFEAAVATQNAHRGRCNRPPKELGMAVLEHVQVKVVSGTVFLFEVNFGREERTQIMVKMPLPFEGAELVYLGSSPEACDVFNERPVRIARLEAHSLEPTGTTMDERNMDVKTLDERTTMLMQLQSRAGSRARATARSQYKYTVLPKLLQDETKAVSFRPSTADDLEEDRVAEAKTWSMTDDVMGKKKMAMPDAFDAREHFKDCFDTYDVPSQETCGGSWAIAAASTFSHRLCSLSHDVGTGRTSFSAEQLLQCQLRADGTETEDNFGCEGGSVRGAFDYIADQGLVPEHCLPYATDKEREGGGSFSEYLNEGLHEAAGLTCPYNKLIKCEKVRADQSTVQTLYRGDEEAIQRAIHRGGAVQAVIRVYQDLLYYKEGVYQYNPVESGLFLGMQSVVLIGWGEANNVKYWVAENSWTPRWGTSGYFKVLRGGTAEQEVEIESFVTFADPLKADCAQACGHYGEQNPYTCDCKCKGEWQGKYCEVCNLDCKNGGRLLDDAVCACDCLRNFSGELCQIKNCPCSKCGPGYLCGGEGNCSPKYDFCLSGLIASEKAPLAGGTDKVITPDGRVSDPSEATMLLQMGSKASAGGEDDCDSSFAYCQHKSALSAWH